MRNLGNIMKQAQQLQGKITKLQQELEEKEYDGQSGGGVVKAVVDGKLVLKKLLIDKTAITPDDPEMLQDLIFAAIRQAQDTAGKTVQEEMSKITGGMGINLPGLF